MFRYSFFPVTGVGRSAVFLSTALLSFSDAHEECAWLAPLAFQHSVLLSAILEAAYWWSESSFVQYYLRNVRRTCEDDFAGISSAILTQTAVSLA